MNKHTSYRYHFLVAMPSLNDDPSFSKAVVLLNEHNEEGALGIIINKPLQVTLKSVLEHIDITINNKKIGNPPVFMGGPVDQEQGFVIYEPIAPEEANDAGYFLSASKDCLEQIAKGKGPTKYLVTLGYSGWKANQLEKEIASNDWLVVPIDLAIIFDTPIEKRWQQAAKLLGIDVLHLSDQTGHA